MRRGRPIALALFAFVVTLRTGRWLSFVPCQPSECLRGVESFQFFSLWDVVRQLRLQPSLNLRSCCRQGICESER